MLDRKNSIPLFFVFALLLAVVAFSLPRQALGQMTIPTRTPVPDGGGPDPEPEPTDDNGGGGGGGGGDNQPEPTNEPDPQPEPTNEPQPLPPTPVPTLAPATDMPPTIASTDTPVTLASATPDATIATAMASVTVPPATETPVVTVTAVIIMPTQEIIAFPEDSQDFPQAGQCGMPPTYTSSEAISVYAGPGEDYELVGLLGEGEIRPIVGRAAFTNWWVLQLDRSGRVGWVTNGTGTLHGFTGRVPILSAPDVNGAVPTRGPAWSPTPDPDCNAPELLAGVVAAKAANEGNGSDSGETAAREAPPSGEPDSLEGLPEYDGARVVIADAPEGEEALIQTAGEQAMVSADAVTTKRQSAADPMINELADSAAPLELSAASSPQLPNLMPIAGLILILAAVFVGLAAKRNRTGISE